MAINRLIIWPPVAMMGFVEQVGGGGLIGRAAASGCDDIGRLGTTLNGMVTEFA